MKQKRIELKTAAERALLTPLGSRVMRPHFGSRLFELVDRTMDDAYMLDAVEYVTDALERSIGAQVKRVDVQKGAIVAEVALGEEKTEVRVVFA